MAKAKEQKKVGNAEQLASYQHVGYIPRDEYLVFKEFAQKARLRVVETKMGEAVRVMCEGKKLYTDAQ